MGRYYNTLKFKCVFPEISMLKTSGTGWPGVNIDEDGEEESTTFGESGYKEVGPNDQGQPGKVFCFAYALPYTYSDLISDLENSKKFLLKNGGVIVN